MACGWESMSFDHQYSLFSTEDKNKTLNKNSSSRRGGDSKFYYSV